MTALTRIAEQLRDMARQSEEGHPPDAFELRVIARKIEAQAELAEMEARP